MAAEEVRITLRLPAPLRDDLLKSAEENARSMNGEIVFRLEEATRLADVLRGTEELLVKREERLFAELSQRRKWEQEGSDRNSLAEKLRAAELKIAELEKKTHRLQEFSYLEGEYEKLRRLPLAEERTIYVLIDADGNPVSWPEIMATVEEIALASDTPLENIEARAFDAKIVHSGTREEALVKLIKRFREQRISSSS